MKSVHDEFLDSMEFMHRTIELNSNVREILHSGKLPQLINDHPEPYKRIYGLRSTSLGVMVRKRQFDSSMAVVYIYSNFEIFIDNLIDEYVKIINRLIPRFDDIPKEIKDNHINLSISLLDNLKRFNYLSISQKDIIENMYKSDQSIKGWQLNFKAFSIHSNNVRLDTIRGLFENVGIKQIDIKIKSTDAYKAYVAKNDLNESSNALSFLDDLVDSRNAVSHGWRLLDYQQDDLLLSLISRMTMLANAIYEVVKQEIYFIMIKRKYLRKDSSKVDEVYRSGKVIVARVYKNVTKSVNEKIIYAHLEGKNIVRARDYRILSIQDNGNSLQNIVTPNMMELGLELDGKARKNGVIYSICDRPNIPIL